MDPIRSVYEDDPDMMEIIEEFAEELPGRATAITEYIEQNDWPNVQTLAHQLKGAGGGYGFPQITEAAAALEQAVKDDSDTTLIKERAGTLCEILRAVTVTESS